MKKIFLRLAYLIMVAVALFVLCCMIDFWMTTAAHAQNIENQAVASQYGSFQVVGQSVGGFIFPPATCQIPAGGKNIDAFTAGVPIKIIDGDPSKTEIATPSSVFIGTCTVNMATTYTHQPPYSLTSGTGGLQEALLNAKVRQGGQNTIILDAKWYEQVQPRSGATVIGSVQGSTSWGLVDVTTVPYTYYQWNGSQYVATASGGGNISGTLTAGHLVLGTGSNTAGPSTATDTGTLLTYPGSGGILSPLLTFGTPGTGDYGILSLTDDNGPYTSLRIFSSTAAGATLDATGIYAANGEFSNGIISGTGLFSSTVTMGQLQNGTPGQPIQIIQNGGGAVTLDVEGGLSATGGIAAPSFAGNGATADTSVSSGSSSNTDLNGILAASSATTISYTFQRTTPYTSHPICLAEEEGSTPAAVSVSYTGVASVTFHFASFTGNVDYICTGRN